MTNEKLEVLKNCKKLKGTKILVSNDYSPVTLRRQKQLWESTRSDKAKGVYVRLFHDKIVIDKETICGTTKEIEE